MGNANGGGGCFKPKKKPKKNKKRDNKADKEDKGQGDENADPASANSEASTKLASGSNPGNQDDDPNNEDADSTELGRSKGNLESGHTDVDQNRSVRSHDPASQASGAPTGADDTQSSARLRKNRQDQNASVHSSHASKRTNTQIGANSSHAAGSVKIGSSHIKSTTPSGYSHTSHWSKHSSHLYESCQPITSLGRGQHQSGISSKSQMSNGVHNGTSHQTGISCRSYSPCFSGGPKGAERFSRVPVSEEASVSNNSRFARATPSDMQKEMTKEAQEAFERAAERFCYVSREGDEMHSNAAKTEQVCSDDNLSTTSFDCDFKITE